MIRDLSSRIAALWHAVAALAARLRPRTARETEAMTVHGLTGATRQVPGGPMPGEVAAAACDELLSRAMASIGIDVEDLALREAALLHDMRRACRSCDARSRCRRDLGTGDFARRYRHYCPNAENISLIAARTAADAASGTGARRPASRA